MLKYLYVSRKKCFTCIPCQYKPLQKLTRLDNFALNGIGNLFVCERLKLLEAYSEPSWTSKMALFAKIFNSWKSLTIYAKSSILDVWLSSEYASASFFPKILHILLRKGVSRGKKLGKLRNEYFQMFNKTWPNRLLLLPKRSL